MRRTTRSREPGARRGRARLAALSIGLGLAVAACGGSGAASELEANRGRWESSGIASYTITVERQCFCPLEFIGPYTATVVDGEVVGVEGSDGPVALDDQVLEGFPLTVDALFDLVEASADADQIRVTYDETIGYPTDIDIDHIEMAVDDEERILVRDLRPA